MRRIIVAAALIAAGCSSPSPDANPATTIASNSADIANPAPKTGVAVAPGGPVAAALRYVASTDTLMAHSSIGRTEIFRSLVVPSALVGQVQAFEEAAFQIAETLELPVERLVWVEAPITALLESQNVSTASVDVWTVSILGAPDAGSPQQVWRTVHVHLEHLDGQWLVADATADVGPTPSSNELDLQSGWDDFALVASWPPVVGGADL